MAAGRQHIHKRLTRVTLRVERLQVDTGIGNARVQRRVNATDHGREVRHKGEPDRFAGRAFQALTNLRQVAMTGHAISLEVVGGLGEMRVQLGLAPGAGHARFGVGDQMFNIHQPLFHQRQESELHGGRVATGVGNEPRRFDLRAVHFRQTIHRLGEQLRAGVRHAIPFFPHGRILEAKIGGQVDKLHARREQRARMGHGNAIRRGREHHVAGRQRLGVRLAEGERHPAPQAGEHFSYRLTRLTARGNDLKFNVRVLGEQPQQLHAGVTGTADDADFDHLNNFSMQVRDSSIL